MSRAQAHKRPFAALFAVVATLCCLLAGGAMAADPIVIKFSHVVAPDTPKGKAAQKFKELAEAYSEGAVRVDIYPEGRLYQDKEEMEALQLGAVEMLAPSLAKFGALGLPQFELFDLPYLVRDYDELAKITKGPVGAELLGLLQARGIKGLAYWDNGFKIMSANRPLHLPQDFRGLKMRIQASRALEAQMLALGASPVIFGFSDVYQALASGVVDGAENPPSNMFTQNIHLVQSHATLSRHGYLGYAVIVNQAFWNRLPPALQGQLERAMDEASDFGNSIARAENLAALQAMEATGSTVFHVMTEAERAQWVAALRPVHRQMAPRIGADLLERAYASLGQ